MQYLVSFVVGYCIFSYWFWNKMVCVNFHYQNTSGMRFPCNKITDNKLLPGCLNYESRSQQHLKWDFRKTCFVAAVLSVNTKWHRKRLSNIAFFAYFALIALTFVYCSNVYNNAISSCTWMSRRFIIVL